MSVYLETLSWKEVLPKFDSPEAEGAEGKGVSWNKNVLAGKILRN